MAQPLRRRAFDLGCALAGQLLVRRGRLRHQAPGLSGAAVTAALAALAAWPLLRSGWAPETVALAGGCLLIWMSAALVSDRARRNGWGRMAAMVWFVAAMISTFAALCQYFGIADELAPWVNTTSVSGEAFANLRQRNQFATLTVIGMAALLFWWPAGLKRWHAMARDRLARGGKCRHDFPHRAAGDALARRCSPASGRARAGNGPGSGSWDC